MTTRCATMAHRQSQTVGSLVKDARARLASAGIESSQQEAVWLLESVLGLSGVALFVHRDQPLPASEVAKVQSLVSRRVAREPLQYILGTQEFCGIEFTVTPAVLIPRPETELLVRQVVQRIPTDRLMTVVDMCTGSGCIAVSVARLRANTEVIATDLSNASVAVARQNADRYGVGDRISWVVGDMMEPFIEKELAERVDVIVSNPPYIADADWAELQPEVRCFEPKLALVAGPRGTEFHERLLLDARRFLSNGGVLIMELGAGQEPAVRRLAETIGGYGPVRCIRDPSGIERVMIVDRAGEE